MVPCSPRSSSNPSAAKRARNASSGSKVSVTSAFARPPPNDVGAGPRPERKVERADQHRLSRSRLAREDRRSLGELHVGALDQPVTLDLKLPQHFFIKESLNAEDP